MPTYGPTYVRPAASGPQLPGSSNAFNPDAQARIDAQLGVSDPSLANSPAYQQALARYGSSLSADFAAPGFSQAVSAAAPASSAAAAPAADYGTKLLPDGRRFDLNDPAQRDAYYQAQREILGSQRDQALQAAQEAFKTGDQQAVTQYQGYLSQLDQNLADVEGQARQYATDYLGTVSGFNESKGQGDVGRQNYFASISPNAFQSSQATSQQYANDKYLQGLGDLANQANQNVGLNYINAFDPANASASTSANLDSGSQLGRSAASVGTQRQGVQNAFDAYRSGAQQNLQGTQSQIGQQYQSALGNDATSLGAVDVAQGTNPFQYGLQSVTPYQAPAPDLSQYTPYTSFSSLSSQPAGAQSSYAKPLSQPSQVSQPQIDQYLNRTNTNLTANQKNDWFSKYLQGKLAA